MHQMRISTTQVSSVMLRSKKVGNPKKEVSIAPSIITHKELVFCNSNFDLLDFTCDIRYCTDDFRAHHLCTVCLAEFKPIFPMQSKQASKQAVEICK
jgi:hypothetical protein